LAEEFRDGNRDAFDKLYSLLYRSQLNFASSMIRDHFMAEDIVQDSFMDAYSNINSLINPRAFVSWLSRITYCKSMENLKKSINRNAKEINIDDCIYCGGGISRDSVMNAISEEKCDTNENRMDVQDAIHSLDADTQALLYMKFYNGMKETEIADIMNIPVGTVKSRISNTKKKLKRILYRVYSLNPFFCLMLHYFLLILKNQKLVLLECCAHSRRNCIIVAAAAAGVSAGVMMHAGNQTPVITGIRLINYMPASVSQEIEVKVKDPDRISEVLLKENAEKCTDNNGIFSAQIKNNGTYTVIAEGRNGKTSDRTISITNIDSDFPEIADPEMKDGKVSLSVSDLTSGIDWNKLSVTNPEDNEIRVGTDPQKGKIIYSRSQLPLDIRISDLAGNWSSVHVSYE